MNGMSGKSFVDTTVLIYAHDVDADRLLSEDLNAGRRSPTS